MRKLPMKLLVFSLALLSLPISAQNKAVDTAGIQGLTNSSSQTRIVSVIDESKLVTLRGNTHPLAQSKYDLGPASVSMPASRLVLVLARSTQQEAALQTYLQSVQDANSPNFQKFLSPEAFGKSFGVGDADLQSIQTWLTGHGFAVNKVSKSRMSIEFSGTVGQLQSAFHTSIHSYLINGEQQWANAADPQIPSALAPVVLGLASLNSFKPKAQYIRGPSALVDTQKHTITPSYTVQDSYANDYIFLGPADAATIYNTPTSLNPNLSGTAYTGAGATIGIVGDSNIDITQNANYRATFGLSANPTTVVIDGDDPGENGDAIEAYLDTQVAGGIAPSASVVYYTAASTTYESGLFLAILRALDDNQADILNVSFGGCEANQGSSGNQYILDLWEQAAAQGISVTVSTGDSGSAGCDNPNTETKAIYGLAVNGLGSTPYNIAVGGTDFDTLYSNFPTSFTSYVDTSNTLPNHRSALKYIPEEPWNDSTYHNTDIAANEPLSAKGYSNNIVAGSGGISSVYPVPAWQTSVATGTGRNLPDVSFLAGNGDYGAMWGLCTDMDTDSSGNSITDCASPTTGNSFNLYGVGGTSASAPAFAGMLALLKQKAGTRLGQADYVLYDLAKTKYSTVFNDVKTGDNSVYCKAGSTDCIKNAAGYNFMSGYDAATGYDMASGLGSVDISQLASNWASAGLALTNTALQLNGATTALNITHGASVAVTASVTSSSGTPSGDIALVDSLSPATQPNNEGITSFTLAGGAVTSTTTYLPGGSYQVSAHYGGSETDAQSDSNKISVTVAAESSTTTLLVNGYYDPETGKAATTPYYGYIYLLDAQPVGNSVTAGTNGAATGTITFKSGTSTLGTAPLTSEGIAELQTTLLPGGNDSLTAVFPGDPSFKASTSAPQSLTVVPAVTTLTPTTTPASVGVGNSETIDLSLTTDSAGVAPTGTVNFMNGSTSLGSAPMVGTAATNIYVAEGTATFTTSATLAAGTYNVIATYSGDGNYGGSSSTPVSFTLFPMSVSMVVNPPSSLTPVNQPVQVSVQLTPAEATSLPSPTGTMTLSFNGQTLPAVNVVNGTATITIPANTLPVGSTTVTANYSGDLYYASNSDTGFVNMKSTGTMTPTVTVTAPATASAYPVSVTVAVGGGSGSPVATGSVSLTNGVNYSGSASLTGGIATFSIQSGLSGGLNTLTASYQGDSNYTSGTNTGTVTMPAQPNISFSPSSPQIAVSQALALTVTVATATGVAAPTGTITLSSGTFTSSPAYLTAGSAGFTIPANSLAVGSDTLTASYSGDTNYLADSNSETVLVTATQTPGLTITGTAVSVAPGATTGNTSTITLTPSGGFTGIVALTAVLTTKPAGAQDLPTLSFGSTTPVNMTTTSNRTATLTISTTAASSSCSSENLPQKGIPWYATGGTVLACVLLFGIPARRRRWMARLGMLMLLAALAGGFLACGGGGKSGGCTTTNDPGTTAGTYTITVNGTTNGTVMATTQVTLTVQ